jgi:Fic family protein
MDSNCFKSGFPGKLLQARLDGIAYWAFDPHPLPPELLFSIPLINTLSQADRSLGELSGLGRTMPNPHLLIKPFVRREAILSSRIEGTETGILDLYAYEAGQSALPGFPAPSSREDTIEVMNYIKGLEYGRNRIKEIPICLRLMRELHEQLLQGVRGNDKTPGEFRKYQNWIGSSGTPIKKARFVPPPIPEMQRALHELEIYIHSDCQLPPLVRIALIHYQFEAIHPFLDGNGRVGRLLISLLMEAWNLLPAPLLYLSAFFEKQKQQYYDLLLAVSTQGAWNEWISFFLHGIIEQSNDAIYRAKQLQELQNQWRERMIKARSSSLAVKLTDRLFEFPILTIPRAEEILGVTYRSAKQTIEKLVQSGILSQIGNTTYNKLYIAQDIFRIIQDR